MHPSTADAETAPLRDPQFYPYDRIDLDGTATTSSFTETMLKHITATGA